MQTFFTDLRNALNGKHANISITLQADGIITCTTLIKGAVNNPQLIGSAEELDQELLNELAKAMQENNIKKLTVNSVPSAEEEGEEDEVPKQTSKKQSSKKKLDPKEPTEPIESGGASKEPDEKSIYAKFVKCGTPVLEAKLEKNNLTDEEKRIIEEILSTRADRTPPPSPKHPDEVLSEIRRKVSFARMKADTTVKGNTEMLKATTDIEEQGILQTELDEAKTIVEKCEDCLKRIEEGKYGIAPDNTLIAKEALIANPLQY